MLHLAAEEARNRKFSILFIDWEVQYRATIDHVAAMRERYVECTEQFYHVCLPMTTVNGVSVIQPEWTAWEPGVSWVRQPPEWAITDEGYFPFYRSGMTFESFVPAFNAWFSRGERAAIMVGIRLMNRSIVFCPSAPGESSGCHRINPGPRGNRTEAVMLFIRCTTGMSGISGVITLVADFPATLCMT